MVLTRENIRNGLIQNMIREGGGIVPVLSEEEIVASYRRAIAHAPEDDIWVFGYGSLIWNPAFHYEESATGRIHGYHRRFCLWTHLGRGSPDNPGMVLGLDNGGCCTGVAFRIERSKAEEEFDVIWRREMVSGAYRPKWLSVQTDDGRRVCGVTFVINHSHERYAGNVSEDDVVHAIATARGPLGPCCEYLFNTVAHLEELGLHDRSLFRLRNKVLAYQDAA